MSLETRLAALISSIGTDYKQLRTWITGSGSGTLSGLTTTDKSSLVAAINENKVNWAAMGIYRPQDYGTIDPTGVADSYAAFQACLTACANSLYGGIVMIPPGRYKIGTGLVFNAGAYDAAHGWGYRFHRVICGAGRGASVLEAAAGLAAPILTVNSTTAAIPSVTIRDVGFNANAQTGATALKLYNLAKCVVDNVLIMGAVGGATFAAKGLHVSGCLKSTFKDLEVYNCVNGIHVDAGNYGSAQNVWINPTVSGCTGYGFYLSGGTANTILGGDFEANGTPGVATSGDINVATGSNSMATIRDVYFENTANGSYCIRNDSGALLVDGANLVPINVDVGFMINTGTCTLKRLKAPGAVGFTCRVNNTGGTLRTEDVYTLTVAGNAATSWH